MSPTNKRSRQQVIIEDVPDDDPATSLPPIPEAIRDEFEGATLLDPNTGMPMSNAAILPPEAAVQPQDPDPWDNFVPPQLPPGYTDITNTLANAQEGQASYIDSVNDGTLSGLSRPAPPELTAPSLEGGAVSGERDAGAIAGVGVPQIRYTEPLKAPQTDDGQPPHALDGEITPPPDTRTPSTRPRYEQRIRIVEAWQFTQGIAKSPDWVDKNWLAWGDDDILRGIPAGPAIKVPGPGGTMVCRHGDYIARQLITLVPGLPPEERIEVWPRESFEKFFIRGAA